MFNYALTNYEDNFVVEQVAEDYPLQQGAIALRNIFHSLSKSVNHHVP